VEEYLASTVVSERFFCLNELDADDCEAFDPEELFTL
jgi:hypothetical protein